jgi:hypothetical protein
MKWVETLEKLWGHKSEKKTNFKSKELSEINPSRVQGVCSALGDTTDSASVEMLMEKGLSDAKVIDLMEAANILNCHARGDIDFQVEKMMAEGVLLKNGYDGIERFNQELGQYLKATRLSH